MSNYIDDTGIRQIIQGVQDDFIDLWGKNCRIVYPPKLVECVNCANGTWKNGGPMPFTYGLCPLCNSKSGYAAQEVSTTIKVLVAWRANQWIYPVKNLEIRVPNNYIETKGYYTDVPKIKNAEYMVVLSPDGFAHYQFKLAGEPIDPGSISQGRYFVCPWTRI